MISLEPTGGEIQKRNSTGTRALPITAALAKAMVTMLGLGRLWRRYLAQCPHVADFGGAFKQLATRFTLN